jgi:hypothetical protein
MNDQEKAIRQKLKDDLEHYANKCLKIRSKSGEVMPFVFNRVQKHIHAKLEEQLALTGKVRALIVKGRQEGCSTYVGARYYHKVTHRFGAQAFILTHALDATQNLYKMAKRFYENTPQAVKPHVATSNAKELIFGVLDSGYKLGTAENKAVGRSATIQLLHGSEVAFWANADEHAKGIFRTRMVLRSYLNLRQTVLVTIFIRCGRRQKLDNLIILLYSFRGFGWMNTGLPSKNQWFCLNMSNK